MDADVQHATSPIHILVDDILEMIFFGLTLQAHDTDSFFLKLTYLPDEEKLPAFSHVCRRWRSVALASPRLWRIIVNTRPTFVRELISRSAAMPLAISLQGRMLAPAALEILTLLRPHVPRIQVFLMRIPGDLDNTYMARFSEILLSSGGQLESIGLHSLSGPFDLPLLFPIQAPRLNTLVLQQVFIPWGCANLEGLTSLTLAFATQPPPIAQLFRLLHKSPSLEKLSLRFFDHISHDLFMTPDDLLALPQFELPRLRSCEVIVLGHSEPTYVLAHLKLPETAYLRISISRVSRHCLFPNLFSPHNCLFLQKGLNTSTHAVAYGCKPVQSPDRADTWTHVKGVECSNITNGGIVNVDWTWSSPSPHVLNTRPLLFPTTIFPALQTLTVRQTFLLFEEWRNWLFYAPDLRELILMPTGSEKYEFDAFHLQGLLGVLTAKDSLVTWPHLRTLAISAVAFAPSSTLVVLLQVCCASRARHGAPITTLVVIYQHGENTLDDYLLTALERIAPVTYVVLPSNWAGT